MEEALNEAGINNYSPSALKEFAGAVAEMLVIFVVSHPNLTVTGVSKCENFGSSSLSRIMYGMVNVTR